MKKIIFYCLFVILVSCSAGRMALEKEIKGTWIITSQTNPKNYDLRKVTMKHGKFESKAISGDRLWVYNQGDYAVINDSLLVTVHKDNNGHLSRFSNLYTIKIQGDTLHFYGLYISPFMSVNDDEARLLTRPSLVDEIWVKE
ncbi:hypothetical protein ACE1ET_07415 [Saccharicrinis sp. FJH62]|uniref:hypothetical protein n=1 Tax=Saccharicrinis sp. FJH62 TaxID=3344657 RepID=UPI0035D3FE74